jgi:hypothetical protein
MQESPGRKAMTIAVIKSRALAGMQAPEVSVEVHLANGLPAFTKAGTKPPYLSTVVYRAHSQNTYDVAAAYLLSSANAPSSLLPHKNRDSKPPKARASPSALYTNTV